MADITILAQFFIFNLLILLISISLRPMRHRELVPFVAQLVVLVVAFTVVSLASGPSITRQSILQPDVTALIATQT